MAQEVFQRYEKKYMLTREQYNQLISNMITKMCPDSYGKHTICNIYFDTLDYQMIRTSMDKPVYKEKIRLRSYGVPNEGDTVFLELKKKYDGVVYKRRVPMTLGEARNYLSKGIKPEKDSQILREIDYAYQFYQARPMVYLAYDRIAFYGNENPELRVTFDMNLRARQFDLDLARGTYGTSLMEEGMMLMEVKIPGSMPMWMSELFSNLKIYPTTFSKYGTYYKNYILPFSETWSDYKGGKICA
ncbi:MAG: polyphosphate polymerase domain-containing protein [Brotaphodocola sp.]